MLFSIELFRKIPVWNSSSFVVALTTINSRYEVAKRNLVCLNFCIFISSPIFMVFFSLKISFEIPSCTFQTDDFCWTIIIISKTGATGCICLPDMVISWCAQRSTLCLVCSKLTDPPKLTYPKHFYQELKKNYSSIWKKRIICL